MRGGRKVSQSDSDIGIDRIGCGRKEVGTGRGEGRV